MKQRHICLDNAIIINYHINADECAQAYCVSKVLRFQVNMRMTTMGYLSIKGSSGFTFRKTLLRATGQCYGLFCWSNWSRKPAEKLVNTAKPFIVEKIQWAGVPALARIPSGHPPPAGGRRSAAGTGECEQQKKLHIQVPIRNAATRLTTSLSCI